MYLHPPHVFKLFNDYYISLVCKYDEIQSDFDNHNKHLGLKEAPPPPSSLVLQ